MKTFTLYQPATVNEVLEILTEMEEYQLMAGGTDLMVRWKRGVMNPEKVVSLQQVEELTLIQAGEAWLEIGAMAHIADLPKNILVQERFPALVQASKQHSSPQIRNLATVVGNICNASPAADLVPVLLIHGAQVKLRKKGQERCVPLKHFFAGPGKTVLDHGELVVSVLLPAPAATLRSAFVKEGKRKAHEIAIANCAVGFQQTEEGMTELRVAMGAVGPTPVLLDDLNWFNAYTPSNLQRLNQMIADAVQPITDQRSTEWYRREIIQVLVKRALEQARS